jgi:hypothetical protein
MKSRLENRVKNLETKTTHSERMFVLEGPPDCDFDPLEQKLIEEYGKNATFILLTRYGGKLTSPRLVNRF